MYALQSPSLPHSGACPQIPEPRVVRPPLVAVLPVLSDPPCYLVRADFGQIRAHDIHFAHRIVSATAAIPGGNSAQKLPGIFVDYHNPSDRLALRPNVPSFKSLSNNISQDEPLPAS
jgi:hypothetical protein